MRRRKEQNQTKLVRRTIKFLALGPDQEVIRAALEKAPDAVIRGICNATVNGRQMEVEIPANLKPLFRQHNNHIDILIDR